MWNTLVDIIRATIFAGSHILNGSLGASIVLVSAAVRLALLPVALRAARQARLHQQRLARLQPQLDRLKARHESSPARLMVETQALYRKHGIPPVPGASLLAGLVQMPLLGGLFAAVRGGLGAKVRFLWIADLSRADILLASMVAGLAGVVSATAPVASTAGSPSRLPVFVSMALTLAFLWSASGAVALSVGAGSAVSMIQNWLVSRQRHSE